MTTTTPRFYNADGTLTRYALACGYIDTWTSDGLPYYHTEGDGVRLSYNGASFDVRVRRANETDHVTAEWYQFATLGQARAFWRAAIRAIRRNEPTPTPAAV